VSRRKNIKYSEKHDEREGTQIMEIKGMKEILSKLI
jgi:hypothetical protein